MLIPRPDTETIVERALARRCARPTVAVARVADLGTGSGCIAITLAAEVPGTDVVATDISAAALEVARANAERLEVAVKFVECSWADALDGAFDLIVSNPPYVTTEELEARRSRRARLRAARGAARRRRTGSMRIGRCSPRCAST